MKSQTPVVSFLAVAAALVYPPLATAEVVRFEILERSEFAEGQAFGEVGAYERITGKVYFAIDPGVRQNQSIVDLKLAPRNSDGKVEFSSDLYILAPKDLSKGNAALLYDVNNRGNKLALRFFNDAPGGNNPKSAGNGFLMRQGFTVVWSGWDGELHSGNARLRLHAPVVESKDKPITGRVRYELLTNEEDKAKLDVNGPGHGAYRPTDRGRDSATLTWRLRAGDRRVTIPRNQFTLHVGDVQSNRTSELPRVELELRAGFRKGYLYELIYEAQNPLIHGVSFASVRDLISALMNGTGNGNPLTVDEKPGIKLAYGFGVSQSGRFLREMLYAGFNEDEEEGGQVFHGMIPHVAGGGLGSFNHRFAQPTAYVTQHQNHDSHSDRFPFSYETQLDPLSNRSDGILQQSVASKTSPKILHTQSTTEYWSRAGSLVHTDPLGTRDSELPKNVRVFAFGGTQHGPASFPPSRGSGQTLANPADYRPHLRALLVALDRWCREGKPAPQSVTPTLVKNTLVDFDQNSTGFPAIPGIRYPEVIQQPSLLDLGPRWHKERIIDQLPPKKLNSYKVLVPRCDADGNELGCLLPPEVKIPLATFTGWNLRARESGAENELVGLNGSYIQFPLTKESREITNDPRRSLAERYGNLDEYIGRLEKYCKHLVRERYLLDEDVARIIQRQRTRAAPLFDAIKNQSERE